MELPYADSRTMSDSLTWASVTPGAKNCESFSNSQMSPRVPSPFGKRAAASRTENR